MSRFAFAVVVLALLLPASAEAQTITVMTRNVFLGADLSPAIEAPGIPQAIDGAGKVWNELQSTKFAERVIPLAREIKASKADLVGLQEVALWRKQTPSDGGAPPISPLPGATAATAVELDFLALLRAQLGSSYRVVVVQEEFDAELPVDADASDATGTGPLAGSGADFDARLTMRDVILVRKGSKVKLGKTRTGHFKTRYEPDVGGMKIPVDRGWTSVEARVGKQKFRFVNTHLEAFGDTKIREAQAKELTQGPAQDQGPGRARRRPQLGHQAPQRAGEAGRRPRLPRARQVRAQGQRRGAELLLPEPVRPGGAVRPHGRPRAQQAGAEDGARERHGQRRRRTDPVRPLALRPRRRGQPPAPAG